LPFVEGDFMKRVALSTLALGTLMSAAGPAFATRTIHNQYNSAGPGPLKMQCGQQTGAQYDWGIHRFTGSPEVMSAWKRCIAGH
jgi:hypothetical protein